MADKYIMPQLITPAQIVTTTTKDGEIKLVITLEININLNSGDVVKIEEKVESKSRVPEIEYEIPDFNSNIKLNFGKKE